MEVPGNQNQHFMPVSKWFQKLFQRFIWSITFFRSMSMIRKALLVLLHRANIMFLISMFQILAIRVVYNLSHNPQASCLASCVCSRSLAISLRAFWKELFPSKRASSLAYQVFERDFAVSALSFSFISILPSAQQQTAASPKRFNAWAAQRIKTVTEFLFLSLACILCNDQTYCWHRRRAVLFSRLN